MTSFSRVHFDIGDTVQLSRGRIGIIKYIGTVYNKYGEWYGIELQNTLHRGKHNGSKKGIFYFETENDQKTGIFVRLHQILYLIKRNKNNKTKITQQKSKMKNRNYIRDIKHQMSINHKKILIPECTQSLIIDIPKDVLQYNIIAYLHSFEKFKLKTVCTEFNDILQDTQQILVSSVKSDIKYWMDHTLSKYYKISPNYFSHLDLTHNRLSYLSREERIAFKYFVIYNRNIDNLLDTKQEWEQKHCVENTKKEDDNVIEMTRISFSNSSSDVCCANIKWISDVLRYYHSDCNITNRYYNINCLKILDLNYIGLTDEYLLKLCEALLSRDTVLSELKYLLLLNNIHITDKYIDILFKTIEKRCSNLVHLNLRRCNLSDISCSIIYNFYKRNHESTNIKHLDIELNTKVTKIGNDKINKIFQINSRKLFKSLIIHYGAGANKKSYCWQCATLYHQ